MRKRIKRESKVFDGIEVSTRLYNALEKYGLMTWVQVASLSELDVRDMSGAGKGKRSLITILPSQRSHIHFYPYSLLVNNLMM